MREALEDENLLGTVMPGPSWAAWRALLIAAMGEALTDDEREHFRRLTGRQREPLSRVEELWCVIGRRGGKTRAAAVLACYFAALVDHADKLAVGERGVIPLLAVSERQATKAFGYAAGVFDTVPLLTSLVESRTADTLRLRNGIDIMVRPASWRTARGDTAVMAIGDEAAFWRNDEGSRTPTAKS
ncbi:hypothetical protein ACFQU1_04900 [Chelatococcus sp. GCM10030263]|uniref:hypothetical protein n=1 Tax=Chelatococcus sp. GCM10030263 TaxID=3273387 RepID=UPI003621A86A